LAYHRAVAERQESPDEQARLEQNQVAFDAYGVKAALRTNRSELLDRLRALLPPGWHPCPTSEVNKRFDLIADETGTYTVVADERGLNRGLELELALMVLESQLRLYLGTKAPDAIFVHAGVVEHRGVAIVLPGKSFAGKTTLVAALVDAGAAYYSDEFAVIDEEGLVHPYAKALSVRDENGEEQTNYSLDSLGWRVGSTPLPLGVIAVTSYRPGAEWRPRRLSAGEGAMALLANAVPAQLRPAQVMRVISRAAGDALVIESARGEADAVAPLLLAEARQTA
jgi:hypothetical protein